MAKRLLSAESIEKFNVLLIFQKTILLKNQLISLVLTTLNNSFSHAIFYFDCGLDPDPLSDGLLC